MNQFGNKLRVSIFGESHGKAIGVTLDGVPSGLELSVEDFTEDMSRRASGARGTTPRRESDVPNIVSGLFDGHTTGSPMTILFENSDTRSGDYQKLLKHPRPSHADFVAAQKWSSMNDYRGGGHFSGRITAPLVAAGVVAKKILGEQIKIQAQLIEVGGESVENLDSVIAKAQREGDSVGGVIECRVTGVPVGWGDPFFDSVESVISHAIFAIPAVRGIEFGAGFQASRMMGSEHNDPIIDAQGTTATNHAAGVVGGISNGNEIYFRVAIKPTPSISKGQMSYNFETQKVEELKIGGRHDCCIALRAAVVVEAATALALAQFKAQG